MALIHVPRPKDAYNPDRPMGSLLRAQIEHLREAESKLPLRYRLEIETYVKAVRTEGEAARYIRAVTDAIHQAHEEAQSARVPKKRAREGKRVIEIAAVADERAEREQKNARTRRAKTSNKRDGRNSRKK